MRLRDHLLFFGCLTILFTTTGCKKEVTPGGAGPIASKQQPAQAPQLPAAQKQQIGSLLRYLPQGSDFVSIIPRIDTLPKQVDAFLKRIEAIRKNEELRRIVLAMQNQIGINPLDTKSLTEGGFDLESPLVSTTIQQKAEKKTFLVLAFHAKDPKKLAQKIKSALAEHQRAKQTRTKKWKDNEITTFYSIGLFQKPNEDLSYTIVNNNTMLIAIDTSAKGIPDPEDSKKHTEAGAAALESLLQLDPQKSLQSDKNLQEALAKSKSSLLMIYTDLKDLAKGLARSAGNNKLRPGWRPMRRSRLPIPLDLSKINEQLPLRWGMSNFSLNEQGGEMEAYLAVEEKAQAQLKLMKSPKGDAASLSNALHKSAILALKGSLDASALFDQLEKLAKGMGVQVDSIYKTAMKITGMDLKKEVVAQATGHGYIALYEVEPGILTEWPKRYRRNPFYIPRYIHLAAVAQVQDPKAVQATLDKVSKTFRLGKQSIHVEKGQHGAPIYSIEGWPGAKAYWTLSGNVFIYSIGNKAIFYSLMALKDPKARLLKAGKDAIMQENGSQALLLDFDNLQKMLQGLELPFTVKLLLGNALQQIQGIHRISAGLSPDKEALRIRGQLQLGEAK
ncbi:MAG: hypothetical protein H6727_12635 [Myxococcales bacterium]|nr:hypothetical protein [Myxococcales bacterium]